MDNLQQQLDRASEQIVVMSAQLGDADAIRRLVGAYEPRLLYFVRRLCGILELFLVVAAGVETFAWIIRYRPAVANARDEHQMGLLRDLDRKITEISRRLDAQSRPPGGST